MSKLYSSREILTVLRKAGFVQVSQRGSHLKMRKVGPATRTAIVKHPDPAVPQGTFTSILKQAGMTRQEFEELLRG